MKNNLLYTLSNLKFYATILTQKNDEGYDVPISFISSNSQRFELKYPKVEKKGFVVFKYVKHFRPYFFKAHTKIIVTHLIVRSLFVQKEMGERWGNLMKNMKEYDIEIKWDKIVWG